MRKILFLLFLLFLIIPASAQSSVNIPVNQPYSTSISLPFAPPDKDYSECKL